MNKRLVAVGIFLSCIWLAVTFISFGLPNSVCVALKGISFGILDKAIDTLEYGFHYDVQNKSMPTVIFLILFSLAFAVYFFSIIGLEKAKNKKSTFFIIIIFSVLFRLILLPSVSIHENDIYRYLWDGKVAKAGINPYKYAPDEVKLEDEGARNREIVKLDFLRRKNPIYFERIGHRQVPTIYPPIAQLAFTASSVIGEDSIFVMKSIFIIFDLLSLLLIVKFLQHFGRDICLSIVYGWSPLVLKEIANSGHYDSLAIFFLLLSLYLILKRKALSGALAMAAAALSKFFPIVLTGLWRERFKVRNLVIGALSAIGLYIPFILWGGLSARELFKGLFIYSEKWAYNGSVFVVLQSLFNVFSVKLVNELFLPKLAVGSIFVVLLIWLSSKKSESDKTLIHKSFVIIALLFILSPVGDPWYFCWVIPFLCLFRYRAFLVLSWLLMFSYLSFARDLGHIAIGPFELPVLNLIQYVPFFILLIIELNTQQKKKLAYVW